MHHHSVTDKLYHERNDQNDGQNKKKIVRPILIPIFDGTIPWTCSNATLLNWMPFSTNGNLLMTWQHFGNACGFPLPDKASSTCIAAHNILTIRGEANLTCISTHTMAIKAFLTIHTESFLLTVYNNLIVKWLTCEPFPCVQLVTT